MIRKFVSCWKKEWGIKTFPDLLPFILKIELREVNMLPPGIPMAHGFPQNFSNNLGQPFGQLIANIHIIYILTTEDRHET